MTAGDLQRAAGEAPMRESRRTGLLRSGAWVAVLAVLPAAMMYPLWSSPISAGEDDLVHYYPTLAVLASAAGGTPAGDADAVRADLAGRWSRLPQTQAGYPPMRLAVRLGPRWGYPLLIFTAFALAGTGMWAYLRALGLARPAAGMGAIALMFSGFFVGHRVHLAMIHTAAFLPWGLWAIERSRRRPGQAGLAMAAITALAATAGHWAIGVNVGLIGLGYALLRLGGGRGARAGAATGATALAAGLAAGIALSWPAISPGLEQLHIASRGRLGFVHAGENSFFPPAAAMATYPMLFGLRRPNELFDQPWWGPWHHCEMLGYVGLATLVLAFAAAVTLVRRPKNRGDAPAIACGRPAETTSLARSWLILGGLCGLWAVGYYLPSYRLLYRLPVVGSLRCPARMLLGVDLALATLAATAMHGLLGGEKPDGTPTPQALRRATRRAATIHLPAAMMAIWALLAAIAWALRGTWTAENPFFGGGADAALEAVRPWNPAVWLPWLLAAATAGAVVLWLRGPRRRWPLLLAVLLADLFVPARFVDVPAGPQRPPARPVSPAGNWMHAQGRLGESRVLSLAESYEHRPAELLLPRTAGIWGVRTLAAYGPIQPWTREQIFGLNSYSRTWRWRQLLRENRLLSLYRVRYVLCEDGSEAAGWLGGLRAAPTAGDAQRADGLDLLAPERSWRLHRARRSGGGLTLRTAAVWDPAEAEAALPPRTASGPLWLELTCELRGSDDGAATELEIAAVGPGESEPPAQSRMRLHAGEIGPHWRTVRDLIRLSAGGGTLRLRTHSERPIELRRLTLRPVGDVGAVATDELPAGERVYALAARMPAVRPGRPEILIFENRLCAAAGEVCEVPMDEPGIERFKAVVRQGRLPRGGGENGENAGSFPESPRRGDRKIPALDFTPPGALGPAAAAAELRLAGLGAVCAACMAAWAVAEAAGGRRRRPFASDGEPYASGER